MTLFWGPLSDRTGRRPAILGSLLIFAALTAATALALGVTAFIVMRIATGIAASGVVPISLVLIGDVFPFAERGRALGWLFGGMAGGIAVGSTAGALAEPVLGWNGLFLVSGLSILLVGALSTFLLPRPHRAPTVVPWPEVATGYQRLLANVRGARTYSYVLLTAVLHSGIYTWLGVYLVQRFDLGASGVGLVLLGYGVPGFLFGPVIGRLADKHGRARIIPLGMLTAAACAFVLAVDPPLPVVVAAIAILSLGYDMTQPLFGGIVTDFPGSTGQAVRLMAFALFLGFGTGSLIFQTILGAGFPLALGVFGGGALLAAALALPLFRSERPH